MAAKQERREELLSLERKRAELDQEKRSIDQAKHDLEIRENRLIELEPLIPSAATLQGYGITLELIFPYMETINENAVAENIDLKTAAYNLTQNLLDYRHNSFGATILQSTFFSKM